MEQFKLMTIKVKDELSNVQLRKQELDEREVNIHGKALSLNEFSTNPYSKLKKNLINPNDELQPKKSAYQ